MQDGRDVGEHREHRAGAHHGQEQGGQHGPTGQHADLGQRTVTLRRWHIGQGIPQRGHRHQAEPGYAPERRAPAEQLTEPGCQRDTANGGQRQAHEHRSDGASAFLGGHHAGRDDGTYPEESAVVERGHHPCDQQAGVVVGQGRHQVAQGEDGHQADQQVPARYAYGCQGHERGADQHTQCIGADQQSRSGNGNSQVGGDAGQHAHGSELGNPDTERAHGERYKGWIDTHG